ncbi:hypothetical protein D9V37_17155 [Nocardioides mangrovicus]|uniref:Uncharacterized protein n=1 Tax=Nocardioides mangrovicus TaxID=2478913 RepID=A0A3L8NYW2_9ACTN|nr:hypothetical protein [Nocardioides mangrovicus]RLV47847.1 hypothetical protein D9V37_17155 [Nocardioides mangrovicus]
MAHSDDLFQKARLLRALASDIEVCCDAANTAAAGSTWDCDNATEVRGAIKGYRGAAQRAAEGIREEATKVEGQARAAEKTEQANATSGAH